MKDSCMPNDMSNINYITNRLILKPCRREGEALQKRERERKREQRERITDGYKQKKTARNE